MWQRAPGLLVAMLIAGVATLAARRLHWPDMLVALGLGLLCAQTLLTKLLRVALLAPVVLALRWQSTRHTADEPVVQQSSIEAVPLFLIVFVALVVTVATMFVGTGG